MTHKITNCATCIALIVRRRGNRLKRRLSEIITRDIPGLLSVNHRLSKVFRLNLESL